MPLELMGLPPRGGHCMPFNNMPDELFPGRKMVFLSADVPVWGERGDEARGGEF